MKRMQHEPLKLKSRARELRQRETPAEESLWRVLRNRGFINLKFRRQHEVSHYILDFYSEELKLAIELDGAGHLADGTAFYDNRRTEELQKLGITLTRIENDDWILNPKLVLDRLARIVVALRS